MTMTRVFTEATKQFGKDFKFPAEIRTVAVWDMCGKKNDIYHATIHIEYNEDTVNGGEYKEVNYYVNEEYINGRKTVTAEIA